MSFASAIERSSFSTSFRAYHSTSGAAAAMPPIIVVAALKETDGAELHRVESSRTLVVRGFVSADRFFVHSSRLFQAAQVLETIRRFSHCS
jgi:hypothetical protein